MLSRVFIWWICFIPIGIFLQRTFPAVDALLIGLILTLQEKRYKDLLWLFPLLVLLQEGMGSREFGGMVLWYFFVIILVLVGRWLFEVQNILFVFLISSCLGVAHFILVYMLAPLQDLQVDLEQLSQDSVIQAVFIPLAWLFAHWTRRWTRHADNT